jgi:AcrR family transcriptional regulator
MPSINISPRKAPRQQRSQETVAVILQAATRVLSRQSLAGFNTNRVAEVAGVSVGSLYQYFPNKAALVTALIDRAQTELAEAFETLVKQIQHQPGNTLAESLQAVAQLTIAQQYANPVFAAALDHEEARLPVQKQLRAAQERLLASVLQLFAHHQKELATDLPESAARDCFAITKALVEMEAGVLRKPPADLDGRIVRALLGYLTQR